MKFFIGSSKEQSFNAKMVASWLEDWNHKPILWEKAFPLGEYTWEALVQVSNKVDAAIFIFGADDKIWFRDQVMMSVRDNVLLEYGLFSGKLSRKRVIFLCQGSPKIASDLVGVTWADIGKPAGAELALKEWVDNLSKTELNLETEAFPKGTFKVADLYEAFNIALKETKHLHSFRVFAISAFKSVQMLRLVSDLKIDRAYILLREYVDSDLFYEESMQNAINISVENWNTMKSKKNIEELNLAYFNYHPDEGFYIIDDRYLITGYLNYDARNHKSEFGESVVIIDNKTEGGKLWISNYIERFDRIYANYQG